MVDYNIMEGIDLFNNHMFFEAHDFFEDIWMECDNKDRLFFQGLVQISVGCFHFISGNYKGALSQWKKSSGKLKKYLPKYRKIDIESLIIDLNVLILEVENGFNDNKNKIEIIPKIKTDF